MKQKETNGMKWMYTERNETKRNEWNEMNWTEKLILLTGHLEL